MRAAWGALDPAGHPPDFQGIEEALLAADVGVATARSIVDRLRTQAGGRSPGRQALRDVLLDVLDGAPPVQVSERPWIILVVGVNGVGKTTTIGKLAFRHARASRRVLLVAGDTFRAAAAEQLAVWAARSGSEIVRHQTSGSPAAVVFDGLKAAVARGVDVVLIDSAGRMHTRENLMEELRKLRKVIEREVPGAPHEVLLVLDATTGQNALEQAREFVEAVGVTGIVLTKLDGTARGGVALAVRQTLGVPIAYVGTGEAAEDIQPFDPRDFVDALVGDGS